MDHILCMIFAGMLLVGYVWERYSAARARKNAALANQASAHATARVMRMEEIIRAEQQTVAEQKDRILELMRGIKSKSTNLVSGRFGHS